MLRGQQAFKAYIDFLPNEKVIILGDLNDLLTDDPVNNVFQMYLDDPTNFVFADMAIAKVMPPIGLTPIGLRI